MTDNVTFERFLEALDTRAAHYHTVSSYKADLLASWLRELSGLVPEVHQQMVIMTELLEQWNTEDAKR